MTSRPPRIHWTSPDLQPKRKQRPQLPARVYKEQSPHDDFGSDLLNFGRSNTSLFVRKTSRANTIKTGTPNKHQYEQVIFEEGEQSSTPRERLSRNNTPALNSKYRLVWQRVRMKLRTRMMIESLRNELNLYGSGASTAKLESKEVLQRQIKQIAYKQEHPDQVQKSKYCLLLPDSKLKAYWDVASGLAVIYIAVFLPYYLAFMDESTKWTVLEYALDCFFLVDLLLTCNLAYYNSDYQLVIQRTKIMSRYLKSWFIFDLCACIPFDLVLASSINASSSTMFSLPKLYRFIRLVKVLKALRESSDHPLLMRFQDFCHLSVSGYRLLVTLVGMFIVIHFVSCLWVFVARLDEFAPETWVARSDLLGADSVTLYIASFYWAVTSFTTVGYGDISAFTDNERVIAIGWMLVGVYFFSFLLSALTNLLSNTDTM